MPNLTSAAPLFATSNITADGAPLDGRKVSATWTSKAGLHRIDAVIYVDHGVASPVIINKPERMTAHAAGILLGDILISPARYDLHVDPTFRRKLIANIDAGEIIWEA